MTDPSVLVLGVGNLIQSDDGVGIHVVHELERRTLPPDVELLDGGMMGAELIGFLQGRGKVIIVDAMGAEGGPGTLYRIPFEELTVSSSVPFSTHSPGLGELLQCCKRLDPRPEIVVYGIVPETTVLGMEMSDAVRKQVPKIASLIQREVTERFSSERAVSYLPR